MFGDQLPPALASLAAGDPTQDLVQMSEVSEKATYVRHRKKKIVQLFAATRHFARELRDLGCRSDSPQALHEWYLTVYADAYEWVELPNAIGMSQFADNGLLASKPYAASGAKIARMSDYCRSCAYNVKSAPGRTPAHSMRCIGISFPGIRLDSCAPTRSLRKRTFPRGL